MGQTVRAPWTGGHRTRPDPPPGALRRLARRAGVGLAGVALATGAAWLAHAALAADRTSWPARVVDTLAGWLRAAWIP